jgi:hypothetical protein
LFELPRSTIKNKFNIRETGLEKLINTRHVRKSELPYNLEEELFSYCLMTEREFFGLTTKSIKRMAFDLAIKNGLASPFSVQQGKAGWKWLCNFMCQHPRLRLLKPQVTSAVRVNEFTKDKVAKFFNIYEPRLQVINLSPNNLFSYDEMGLTVDQHKVCKIISLKGKQWVSLSSAERSSLVTIVTCMNATVTYVPHLLVFSRNNMKAELLDSAPPRSAAACHRAGWVTKMISTQWLNILSVW